VLLQARVEELFEIAFGPGELGADLRRLGEAENRPPEVRDLLRLVTARLPPGAGYAAPRLRETFYRLRQAIMAECRTPRERIRPSARLEDVIPRRERGDHWRRLGLRLGQELPAFAPSSTPMLVSIGVGLGVAAVLALGILLAEWIDSLARRGGFATAWWFMGLACCLVPTSCMMSIALAVGGMIYLLRHRYQHDFPASCSTVRDLVLALAAPRPEAPAPRIPWTEESCAAALGRLVAEAAHLPPSRVGPDMRLAEDLNLALPG
jgi:hypothetical protein